MNQSQPGKSFSERVAFVTLAAVRSRFGCDAESVLRRVDDGTREDHIRWVFNLSAGSHRRELRFWASEIIAPETCSRLTLGQVVNLILGQRQHFRRGELEIEWVCNHMTISALLRAKALNLCGTTIPRAALEKFLRSRWIGCSTV